MDVFGLFDFGLDIRVFSEEANYLMNVSVSFNIVVKPTWFCRRRKASLGKFILQRWENAKVNASDEYSTNREEYL